MSSTRPEIAGGGNVSKAILKTAEKYRRRICSGERIMRDASGTLQWASGRSVGRRTIQHMLETGQIEELDTDIFGDPHHGQTLGVKASNLEGAHHGRSN